MGLVGNQGSLYPAGTFPANPAAQASRDPLTFLASSDGLHFDRHWVVREGAPTPKWQVEAEGLAPGPSPPPTHTLHALPRAALCSPKLPDDATASLIGCPPRVGAGSGWGTHLASSILRSCGA